MRIRFVAASLILLVSAGCSTGPGEAFDPSGDYIGSIQGSLIGTLEFTVSGNSISGTATLNDIPTAVLRGIEGMTAVTLSGTRTGIEINATLFATTNLEWTADNGATWTQIHPPLTFSGAFTNTGAVAGLWVGDFLFPFSTQNIRGNWSGLKQSSSGASPLRP